MCDREAAEEDEKEALGYRIKNKNPTKLWRKNVLVSIVFQHFRVFPLDLFIVVPYFSLTDCVLDVHVTRPPAVT